MSINDSKSKTPNEALTRFGGKCCRSVFVKLKSLVFVLVFLVFFVFSSKVQAQESSRIIVAPPKQEISVMPGERTQIRVMFVNASSVPLSGMLKKANLTVVNNRGTPELLAEEDTSPYAAAAWATLPYDRLTIPAENHVELFIPIEVPEDARPGGNYFAVYLETTPSQPSGDSEDQTASVAGIATQIASLVYVVTEGEAKVEARLVDFSTSKFIEHGPITVEAEVLNTGDVHISPQGYVVVTNLFGQITDQVEITNINIFPERSRVYTHSLGERWMFGRYKLSWRASYDDGQLLEEVVHVWVVPWSLIAIFLLTIGGAVLFIRRRTMTTELKVEELNEKLAQDVEEVEKLRSVLDQEQQDDEENRSQ